MDQYASYYYIIAGAVLLLISLFFNRLAERTRIPSVLMLIGIGLGIQVTVKYFGLYVPDLSQILQVLGIIGLILIVLEAALELELKAEKTGMILRSFTSALIGLVVCALLIGALFYYLFDFSFAYSLMYAIPLSILSSAIIIPSVHHSAHRVKEFMVYESAFSDILGIIFFYFYIDSLEINSAVSIVFGISTKILLTILVSFVVGYAICYLFPRVESSKIKFFPLVALLLIIYAIGKITGISSLLIIMVVGLMLNNVHLFLFDWFEQFIDFRQFNIGLIYFKSFVLETAFLVRTYFFVVFGMTIDLQLLGSWQVYAITLAILGIIYGSRWLSLKVSRTSNVAKKVFIAPRGLITILLFLSIPAKYVQTNFNQGVLLTTILATCIIMMIALMIEGNKHKTAAETPAEEEAVGGDLLSLEIEENV